MIRTILYGVFGLWLTTPALSQGFDVEILAEGVYAVWDITAADYDGDGDLDFATSSKPVGTAGDSGVVAWHEMRIAEPPLMHQLALIGGDGGRHLTTSDLDRDEDADLVVAGYGENRIIEFENVEGTGSYRFTEWTLDPGAAGAWNATAADLDEDLTPDLITCNYSGGSVKLLRQSAGVFFEVFRAEIPDPSDAFAIDVDADLDLDVLVASADQTDGGLYLIEQIEALHFEVQHLVRDVRLTSVAAADFDEDEDVDYVAAAFTIDRVIWWERRPTGLYERDLTGIVQRPRSVELADFDGDNRMDIIVTSEGEHFTGRGVRWWRNEIGINFTGETIIQDDLPSAGIAVVDFDRDGDTDVLVGMREIGEIRLLRNQLGTPALIAGSVTALSGGESIEGVQLSILETGATVFTDPLGLYVLETGEGVYTVEAEHRCWIDIQLGGVAAVPGETTALDIELRRPQLELSASSLNLIALNHRLTLIGLPVANVGDGEMQVRAEVSGNHPNDDWLSVIPATATIAPAATQTFDVYIEPDTADDRTWDYTGEIILFTDACPDTEVHVAVHVHVVVPLEQVPPLPRSTRLLPAYPNPFNGVATIRYALESPSIVSLALFDVTGRKARVLESGPRTAGEHAVSLDGSGLASGTYVVRLAAGGTFYSQSVVLLR